jgi:hypothetical protein
LSPVAGDTKRHKATQSDTKRHEATDSVNTPLPAKLGKLGPDDSSVTVKVPTFDLSGVTDNKNPPVPDLEWIL